ncbi:bifunctional phosphoglucose/phosphomannose isomerase [Candidatus Bipolaricaulota bacterium]|nr:bifunctional phosphoglucose/phosphomannose isomerase [Candidatus Bipolaricaulota bacterium]
MTELDEERQLQEYDKGGMIAVIEAYPDQCREGIALGDGFRPEIPTGVDKVIVCGMGGSAMAGEVARRFSRVPVFVNRNYTLPSFAGDGTLIIAVSYSGNTAETISGLDAGLRARIPAFAVSSGGKLEEIARSHGIPHLRVPRGYQPRAAMGYLALSVLRVLAQAGLLRIEPDWEELIHALESVRDASRAAVPEADNPAKQLARSLYGRIPLFYGTAGNTDLVAMRWKTQVNENSKQPAFWNVIPELNHNEIVGFSDERLRQGLSCVFLENDYDHPENRARIEIMHELLHGKVPAVVIGADGRSELSQVLSQIHFGDYVSYYLAILNQIDPTPVELIESFKRRMSAR